MPSAPGLYLRRYPYLFICLAIGSAGLVLYLVPGLPPPLVTRYNDDAAYVPIGGVLTYAMARRARWSSGLEERRLWGWFAVSFALWTGAELIATIAPEANDPGRTGLPTDLLFFLSYAAWFLGVNQAPHHPSGWTDRQPGWRLEQWGTLVVALGLALDVGILPQVATGPSQLARFSSSGLFVAFDAVIFAQLMALANRAKAAEWRRWYGVLAVMAAGMLAMDALTTAIEHNLLPAYHGPWYDLAWYLPFWVLGAACSLPTPQPVASRATDLATRQAQAEEGASLLEGGLVLYTAAFVVIHLLVGLTPLVSAAAAGPRALLALTVVLSLGLLAYRRQVGLEARVSQLSLELRQATFDLAQSQKLQAIARLAGGVAHAFNNLLTVILGQCELLQWKFPEPSAERSDLARIQEAGQRAARLTSDLLQFGDPEPLQLEQQDLNELVENCQRDLLELAGTGITLSIQKDGRVPPIPADPPRLRAAVMRLALNAVEAMPGGGHLTVATSWLRFDPASPERPSLVPPGSYALLSIADSGHGMDPATQARLFEPFFTTKAFGKSHGLGLAAVHGIVTRHGGHILIQSELGRGTRFDLLFPAPGADHRLQVVGSP